MGDLISRQAAIDEAEEWIEIAYCERGGQRERDAIQHVIKGIKKLPSVQPDIIRCKDCKHKGTKNCVANAWTTIFGVTVKDDFYCGLAERRTE